MLEIREDYRTLVFLPHRPLHCTVQFYGQSEGEVVRHGDPASGKFGAYWVKDGAVVGAFLEGGSAEENAAIKKAVVARPAAPADLAAQGLSFALGL